MDDVPNDDLSRAYTGLKVYEPIEIGLFPLLDLDNWRHDQTPDLISTTGNAFPSSSSRFHQVKKEIIYRLCLIDGLDPQMENDRTAIPALVSENKSLSTQTSDSHTSKRSPLEAITIAINNQMKSITPPQSSRKERAIERPFGESITTIDVFTKLLEKEKKQKKKSEKVDEGKQATKTSKAARG